jgi:hypothetical protein
MDPVRGQTDNNGEGEAGTSNTDNLINGLDRKRREVTARGRQILGNLFSDEAATLGARRNGEESETPTKVGASGFLFSLRSPSPRQANARRKLRTPTDSDSLDIYKLASVDTDQQLPALISREQVCHSPGAGTRAPVQPAAENAVLPDASRALWVASSAGTDSNGPGSPAVASPTAVQEAGYTDSTLLRKGLDSLLPQLEKYLDKKSKKARGPAEFTYNKAQEVMGGVRFRAEHSGFELSNHDGIKVLEKTDVIAAIVEKTYPDDTERRKEVKDAMRIFKRFGKCLLPLSKLMKSQERIDGEGQKKFQTFVVEYTKAWRQEFPGKTVFNKLHHMLHLIEFIKEWEFLGRVSEEGFEAFHPFLAKLLKDLKAMPCTQARVKTASQRFSVRFLPTVQAIDKTLTSKGAKRGPYKSKDSVTRENESLSIVSPDNSDSGVPDGLTRLTTGEYLKEEWIPVAEFVMAGRVPVEWKSAFADAHLGSVMSMKAEYCT